MDHLRLPTVPPPAPATHPWRDRALIAIVAVLLPVTAALNPPRGPAIMSEQRRAAAWPSLAMLASPEKFGAAFGQAFADRFGMRTTLIIAQHWALVDIFGVTPVENVMIGRDGWLFWLGEDALSLDRHYRGTRTVPDFEADAYVAEVKRRHEYYRSRGIAYLTLIVPEKFTIYPEYLPSWVAPARGPTLLARTMDRLAQDGGVPYVDLRPLLLEAKGRVPLYYATDSHWNLAGAGVAYVAIMRTVQTLLPGRLPSIAPPVRPPYTPGRDVFWGDLARMLGIPFRFNEPDYLPLAAVTRRPRRAGLLARSITPNGEGHIRIYEQPRADLPRLVMNRDSMAIALIPMLSENFHRSVYVLGYAIERETIEREHPDIVIDEVVERGMIRIAQFPMKP
jgi:alginate O-acetyltransferase complex protein AlgJ